MDLGLGYLALDRAAATLSTGERQRMQLARAVRNRTTGVLYVLDEPSIGQVIAEGTVAEIENNADSSIGVFLSGRANIHVRKQPQASETFSEGCIHMSTFDIHTVKPLEVDIPKGRLTVVTGVSGSEKTTMVLESLVPGLKASICKISAANLIMARLF